MRKRTCAYCGSYGETQREHAIPDCLYPRPLPLGAQLVTVPACPTCNASFQGREEMFRTFILLAGEATETTDREFRGPLLDSLRKPEFGRGKLAHLMSTLEIVETERGPEMRIFPVDGYFRIIEKMARGLTYKHFRRVISPERAYAFPYIQKPPLDWEEHALWVTVVPDVQYHCHRMPEHPGLLIWTVRLYQNRDLITVVVFDPPGPSTEPRRPEALESAGP